MKVKYKQKKKVKARIYAGLVLARGECSQCNESCIICRDGTSSCCGAVVIPYNTGVITKETSTAYGKLRKQPSRAKKLEIIENQNNKCYWCGREFGTMVLSPTGNITTLEPRWDHYIPYFFVGHSSDDNFVASCTRCNLHKSAKILIGEITEDKLRAYLTKIWYKGGWQDLKSIPNDDQESTARR